MRRVVSRVDHVVIESADEQALFDFFHMMLGLPVAWPMAQWGPIHEGGINVGNCNIGCNHKLDPNSPDEPRIAAIAFEPYGGMDAALRAMDELGLEHTDPIPSGPIEGAPEPWNAGWTNALILDPPPISFLCEYHHDTNARREQQAEAFTASPNPFGITDLRSIEIRSSETAGWAKLRPDQGVELVTADGDDRYASITFGTRSSTAARDVEIPSDLGFEVRFATTPPQMSR